MSRIWIGKHKASVRWVPYAEMHGPRAAELGDHPKHIAGYLAIRHADLEEPHAYLTAAGVSSLSFPLGPAGPSYVAVPYASSPKRRTATLRIPIQRGAGTTMGEEVVRVRLPYDRTSLPARWPRIAFRIGPYRFVGRHMTLWYSNAPIWVEGTLAMPSRNGIEINQEGRLDGGWAEGRGHIGLQIWGEIGREGQIMMKGSIGRRAADGQVVETYPFDVTIWPRPVRE